jgi:hypothetical protein
MCRESSDSYLNKASQLNENKTMKYLHGARHSLFLLKQLHMFPQRPQIELLLTKAELQVVLDAQQSIMNVIELVEKRVCSR